MRRVIGRFARDVVRRALRGAALSVAICGLLLPIVSAHAAAPARIVSTSPSITETLFALGLGERVVGVSTYCRFPAEVQKLPKVGTFLKPDAELIAGLRPDLVLVHELSTGIDRSLASLRIPFVVVDRGTLASVFSSIRQIAQAAGDPARGGALVADIERRLERVRRGADSAARPRVLFIIGRNPGTLSDLVAVGPGSYIDNLIEIAGGRNVLAIHGQPEYPRISMETVLRLDPEVIVDTVDMGETEAERRVRQPINERLWTTYGTLTAVKTLRLHAATTDALVVPGPRVVDAAEWVAALLRERSGR
jgi:iron complex transport system substrate-binding protein